MLEHTLSEEEHSQIVQTIEMFEVITQTQPDDYQSLEILKVAYQKLGKTEESLRVSRRLAEAYFNVGSFTLAMQECEAILVTGTERAGDPRDARRYRNAAPKIRPDHRDRAAAQNAPFADARSHRESPGAGSAGCSRSGGRNPARRANASCRQDPELGNDQLAKFLIVQQMFPEDEVNVALDSVKAANKVLTGQTLAVSLLDRLCHGQ